MSDTVAVITGTSRGIGRHLARHYVQRGHRVIGCSRHEPDWTLDGYDHLSLDIADERAVKELFRHVRRSFGHVDYLINNAGIASMNHSLTTPLATFRSILETNVVGTFLFCREAAKLMRSHGGGRIVNFSTIAVPLRLEGEAAYVASKAAVEYLTDVLAKELAPFSITVNTVGPGPLDTDLTAGVPKDKMRALLGRQVWPRPTEFAELANVVDFFFHRDSYGITGQHIYLGGLS